MERGRVEAFSDGVIAVAITLLALNLVVPGPGHGPLLSQLADRWPSFLAYLLSFFTIGIVWVNHHTLMRLIGRISRTLLFLNLVLLLFVVLMPFATGTAAEYLTRGGGDASGAMAMFAGTLLGMAIGFTLIFEWALRHGAISYPSAAARRRARLRFTAGTIAYVAAIGISFVNALAAFLLLFAVAVYYIFEHAPTPQREHAE
ncbi:MAG: DUF1211 domain-containing protein [Candidatus Dormibacteraeota bacterium]|nr:DUF1211 domain-containing protein [Candidatus Dormibacteraeota bacterium]